MNLCLNNRIYSRVFENHGIRGSEFTGVYSNSHY